VSLRSSAGSGQAATVDTDFIALDALVVDGTGQPVRTRA
jgi:hypothetical protein